MKRSSWRYLWKSEDIRNKLLITLLLLAIYRFAANIPVPALIGRLLRLTQLRGAEGNLINHLLDYAQWRRCFEFLHPGYGVYPILPRKLSCSCLPRLFRL